MLTLIPVDPVHSELELVLGAAKPPCCQDLDEQQLQTTEQHWAGPLPRHTGAQHLSRTLILVYFYLLIWQSS